MRHKVHRPLQCQDGHIEAIRLWREFEVRMHIDAPHAERVRWQWFNGGVDYVIAESDVNLARCGTRHTMTGGDDVTARHQ